MLLSVVVRLQAPHEGGVGGALGGIVIRIVKLFWETPGAPSEVISPRVH